jgi:protein-tyrosine phosphatase
MCRSPGAEVLARFYAEKHGLKDVSFDSAGWHKAFPTAVQETQDYILENYEIDMTDFKSKIITRDLIEKADLIIGMERYHLTRVRKAFKDIKEQLKDKLYTLKQYNGAERKEWNIPDPYQTGKENYYRIMKIVDENVKSLVKKISKLNSA